MSLSIRSRFGTIFAATLGALVALTVVAHLHTERIMAGAVGFGHAIDFQRHQGVLAERAVRLAIEVAHTADTTRRAALRERLRASNGALVARQGELWGHAGEAGFPAHVQAAARRANRDDSGALLQEFVSGTELLAQQQPTDKDGIIAAVDRLESIAQRLLQDVETAVQRLQSEQVLRIRFANTWNMAYLLITLGFLVFLGLVVFRPLVRSMATEREVLERSKTKLERRVGERTEELERSEGKLRAILATSIDGVATMDLHGNLMTFNRAAQDMFGYGVEEIIGTNIAMLIPEDQRSAQLAVLRASMEQAGDGNFREIVVERKDGETFPLEIACAEQTGSAKRLFTAVFRDVTERNRVRQMKNEFISLVSHELRTPLTSIRGSLGLLAGGAMGELPAKARSLIEIAANNSERLVRLINDILDIEKIEAGRMNFDRRPVDVTQVVHEAIDSNRMYATRTGTRFEIVEELPGAQVSADPDRIRQVLDNLLSNAVKFSPSGESVEVAICRRDGYIRISVRDKGVGISEAFQTQIFEKFAQADSSDTRSRGGTGLGLSISKAIVEQHGGVIAFDTEPGKGATFFFDLPELHVTEALTPIGERGKRDALLVIEDDKDVARLLTMMLEREQIPVDVAHDATHARALLAAHAYRAITLDLMLPDQDGVALFRELRRDARTRDTPIVVVSAIAGEGRHELNGGAMDVVDWIGKPIDEGRLIDAVGRAIGHEHRRAKVLHVEDDVDIARIVARVLQGLADVDNAATLAAGRQRLQQGDYDLVVLDIVLPDGSGLELLPVLSAKDPAPAVIIFSAREVDEGISSQVSAALVKSHTSNETLIDRIRGVLRTQTPAANRPTLNGRSRIERNIAAGTHRRG